MKKLLIGLFILICFGISAYALEENELPSVTGKVTNSQYADAEDLKQDSSNTKQIVTIKLTSGEYKGQQIRVENMLTGNPAYDINIKKGDSVILHAEKNAPEIMSNEDITYYIADIKRDNTLYFTFGIFCLALIVIGRKKGIRSLLSIALTVGLIFYLLIPMILSGWQPIFSAIIIGILSTVITIYLVGGLNPKSTSAILGTIVSLIFAGIMSICVIVLARLTGFSGEETMFLYTAYPTLNFKGILAAAMIIAALGALMDTAVSIASTINEIHETDKNLSVKELFISGMNVGRDIIGTMSNTLILVYLGSSLPLVLLSSNIDLQKFFNLNQVATEISSAIIGSIAILACVPITALIAAILIKKRHSSGVNFKF